MKGGQTQAYLWAVAAGLATPMGWQILDDFSIFQETSITSALYCWCAVLILLCIVLARRFRNERTADSTISLFFKLLVTTVGAGLLSTSVYFITSFGKIGG